MNLVIVLRWLLALLSAPFGFYLALYVGIFADGFVASFCPPERVVSGLCTTIWYSRAGDAIVVLGAALAAVLVVLLPALLAPAKRFEIAMTFYILGAATVLIPTGGSFVPAKEGVTVDLFMLSIVVSALTAGALTLLSVKKLSTGQPTSEQFTRAQKHM